MPQTPASDPGLQDVLAEVGAALNSGATDRASRIAETAVARGLSHPQLFNLAAYRLELDGRYEAALDILHRALEEAPNDAFLLNSIGVCFTKVGAPDEALKAFQSALSLQPNLAPAHQGCGLALAALGDRATAYRAHQRAAALAPAYPDPWGSLAALACEDEDAAAARDYAARALALDANQPAAVLALATLEVREQANEAALERLDRLIDLANLAPLHQASALRLRADALDALDRPAEAIDAYLDANRQLRELYLPEGQVGGAELGLERAQRLLDYFEGADPSAWRAAPSGRATDAGQAGHVFLLGFPRSGTTLLEQVLASHPDIVALEERPTLDASIMAYFANTAGLDQLSRLDAEEADRRREAYWETVRGFGVDPADKVFIDKLPLNTLYLPLIARLFPAAKVILAIRDPRDVVVSCFRRRFKPNPLVIEYTDLVRTAEFYGAVMRLATRYRDMLALPVYQHQHERLIEEFDAETHSLCDFLGLNWEAGMRDFVETANKRDIRTPSAPQVRRGLYQEGMGQWRRYGAAIDAIQPILAPWVSRYGYPAG